MFKINDKVICIDNTYLESSLTLGNEYVVSFVAADGYVMLNNCPSLGEISSSRFILASLHNTFKIGSKVVCIDNFGCESSLSLDKEYEINDITQHGLFLNLKLNNSFSEYFASARFKLAHQKKEQEKNHDFKVGDKVVCIDKGMTALELNKEYEITKVDDLYVYLKIAGITEWSGWYKSRFKLVENKVEIVEKLKGFKVGDKVVCIDNSLTELDLNKEYEITKNDYFVSVNIDKINSYNANRFKLVETKQEENPNAMYPTTITFGPVEPIEFKLEKVETENKNKGESMFKAGDNVMCIKTKGTKGRLHAGVVYKVKETKDNLVRLNVCGKTFFGQQRFEIVPNVADLSIQPPQDLSPPTTTPTKRSFQLRYMIGFFASILVACYFFVDGYFKQPVSENTKIIIQNIEKDSEVILEDLWLKGGVFISPSRVFNFLADIRIDGRDATNMFSLNERKAIYNAYVARMNMIEDQLNNERKKKFDDVMINLRNNLSN